jgi:hypothetical protein
VQSADDHSSLSGISALLCHSNMKQTRLTELVHGPVMKRMSNNPRSFMTFDNSKQIDLIEACVLSHRRHMAAKDAATALTKACVGVGVLCPRCGPGGSQDFGTLFSIEHTHRHGRGYLHDKRQVSRMWLHVRRHRFPGNSPNHPAPTQQTDIFVIRTSLAFTDSGALLRA